MLEDLMRLIKHSDTDSFLNKLKLYNKKGLSVDHVNQYGNTLLHMACRSRNYNIVETLIRSYNARGDIQNMDGRTALHMAAIYGSTDLSYFIFQNGSTKKQVAHSSDIIGLIVDTVVNKTPYILLMKDKDSMTPINYFSSHSKLESNKSLNRHYSSYKRKTGFFDLIKNSSSRDDYESTMSIYFLTRSQRF